MPEKQPKNTAETTPNEEEFDDTFFDGDEDDGYVPEPDDEGEEGEPEETEEDEGDVAGSPEEQTKDGETGEEETPKPEQEAAAPAKEEKKAPQSAEVNSEFARRRREAEQQEKIRRAEEDARVKAVIEAVGINPYTKEPITDAEDVDQYILMKRIEREGGDPVADFPKFVKKQNAEKAAEATAEADRVATQKKDIEDFQAAYPDVKLQDLANDADFDTFCDGKLGNKPLKDIYASYLAFRAKLIGDGEKKAQQKAVSHKAKENASVGSLANEGGEADGDLYTREQLARMSVDEILRNDKKVQRSMAALNKK